ncbi:MAG TPA: TolC family protein, partial [Bacteroidetes bacterium]|nr:TolC family protein [Bacteroidota bacterium]
NFSWEIDIWRQLRNARDAASLRFLATQEGQNYIVTRLVAEIAENYYELMALDNRLATLDATIRIQEQSLQVAQRKKAAGQGTELAVQRFLAEVRKNQSRKFAVQQQIVQVENHINFLLGRNPQPIERPSNQFLDLPLPPLSVGVPAQLLQNRPDIRQAERELAAAGLDVLVARAEFFPKLDIVSGIGLNAFNTAYLLTTPESLIYNVAGELTAPLINRTAIRAEYLSANARQLQALYKYQQTVLNAFVEVVNGMNRVANLRGSIQRKREQVQALETSVDVATRLFIAGESDYIEVLLAQRELQEARLELIEARQQQLAAVVNTYQALGGGGTLPGLPIMPDTSPPPPTWEDWLLRPFERLQPLAFRPFGLGGFHPFKHL